MIGKYRGGLILVFVADMPPEVAPHDPNRAWSFAGTIRAIHIPQAPLAHIFGKEA